MACVTSITPGTVSDNSATATAWWTGMHILLYCANVPWFISIVSLAPVSPQQGVRDLFSFYRHGHQIEDIVISASFESPLFERQNSIKSIAKVSKRPMCRLRVSDESVAFYWLSYHTSLWRAPHIREPGTPLVKTTATLTNHRVSFQMLLVPNACQSNLLVPSACQSNWATRLVDGQHQKEAQLVARAGTQRSMGGNH